MEACARIADVFAVGTTQGAEFSRFLLSRPSSILAVLPIDAIAPPRKAVRWDTQRAVPRTFVRRMRRTQRRSLDYDDGGEEGYSGDGDGDDGAFGGGGGGGGGGAGGGGWWNFEGYGGADWGDSGFSPASSDPAFDFVYGVISCVALYSCTQFAFKRVSRFVADKEKVVPLRLVPRRLLLLLSGTGFRSIGSFPEVSALAPSSVISPIPALSGWLFRPRPQTTRRQWGQRMEQRYKQQQALMQQAMFQQQQQLYQTGVLAAAMSQMEPVPSGNLPPGFDSSSCRSVYIGNIHPNVTESLLAEVFQSIGPLEGCKLIRKEKSSFGFVDYHDRRSAALAIMTLHGRQLYGQAIKVNWAYASGQREDTSGHFNIFVGDLSPEVTDATLYACFSVYSSCSDARVMWDHKTGRSRGYGFVSFRNQEDAQSAINDMTGKWLGNRQIRCNWATKGAGEEKQNNENQNAVVLTGGSSDGGQESSNEAPENNPAYTTVYVGNLAHEVTQAELHRQFHNLGAGVIEEVRIQREKGFGFVRYRTHEEAALAIQMANGMIVCGKSMKCSWGTKPTPPGTVSNPLPPPGPPFQLLPTPALNARGYTAAELLAYQRQLALAQAATGQGLAAQASAGLSSAGSQGLYDAYPINYYH